MITGIYTLCHPPTKKTKPQRQQHKTQQPTTRPN